MSTEDFDSKTPDHPDFMTANELKKIEFSGLRVNSLSGDTEIWVLGEIRRIVDKKLLEEHPNAAITNAFEDIFGLHDVQIEGD